MKINIYFWTILNRIIIFSIFFLKPESNPIYGFSYTTSCTSSSFFSNLETWFFFPENLTQDEMQKHIFLRWRCNASTFHCCDFQVHFNTYHFRSCKINILVICGLNCITSCSWIGRFIQFKIPLYGLYNRSEVLFWKFEKKQFWFSSKTL